jgi:hypothetical protein
VAPDPPDLRQWIPWSEARLIHEANRGRCAEVASGGYGGDPRRLADSIWQVAHEYRLDGREPFWVWVWRVRLEPAD